MCSRPEPKARLGRSPLLPASPPPLPARLAMAAAESRPDTMGRGIGVPRAICASDSRPQASRTCLELPPWGPVLPCAGEGSSSEDAVPMAPGWPVATSSSRTALCSSSCWSCWSICCSCSLSCWSCCSSCWSCCCSCASCSSSRWPCCCSCFSCRCKRCSWSFSCCSCVCRRRSCASICCCCAASTSLWRSHVRTSLSIRLPSSCSEHCFSSSKERSLSLRVSSCASRKSMSSCFSAPGGAATAPAPAGSQTALPLSPTGSASQGQSGPAASAVAAASLRCLEGVEPPSVKAAGASSTGACGSWGAGSAARSKSACAWGTGGDTDSAGRQRRLCWSEVLLLGTGAPRAAAGSLISRSGSCGGGVRGSSRFAGSGSMCSASSGGAIRRSSGPRRVESELASAASLLLPGLASGPANAAGSRRSPRGVVAFAGASAASAGAAGPAAGSGRELARRNGSLREVGPRLGEAASVACGSSGPWSAAPAVSDHRDASGEAWGMGCCDLARAWVLASLRSGHSSGCSPAAHDPAGASPNAGAGGWRWASLPCRAGEATGSSSASGRAKGTCAALVAVLLLLLLPAAAPPPSVER
mmetsp:Transcript_45490/g.145023  ORF Transcript_45490/g.145023 Transcript_45490/m.145023 type:complete len:587 (-) Transcript_45490:355-2115(-)